MVKYVTVCFTHLMLHLRSAVFIFTYQFIYIESYNLYSYFHIFKSNQINEYYDDVISRQSKCFVIIWLSLFMFKVQTLPALILPFLSIFSVKFSVLCWNRYFILVGLMKYCTSIENVSLPLFPEVVA